MKIDRKLIENGVELVGFPFRKGSKQEAFCVRVTLVRSPRTGRRNTKVQLEGWNSIVPVTLSEMEVMMVAIRKIIEEVKKLLAPR